MSIPVESPGTASDPLVASPHELDALAAATPYRRVAVIGDSLSAGVGDPRPGYPDAGWAAQVAERLRGAHPGVEYRNTGTIGALTAAVAEGQLAAALEFGPDLIHLPSAANDIVRREPDLGAIERDLRVLYDAARGAGARIATFTLGRAYDIPKIPDFRTRVRRVDVLIRELAAEYDAILVDMEEHPVNDRADLVSDDGIHFSAVGQAVMATETLRALAGS